MAKDFEVPKLDYKIAKPAKKSRYTDLKIDKDNETDIGAKEPELKQTVAIERDSRALVSKKLNAFVTELGTTVGQNAETQVEPKEEISEEKRAEAKQRAKSAIENLIMRQKLSGLLGSASQKEESPNKDDEAEEIVEAKEQIEAEEAVDSEEHTVEPEEEAVVEEGTSDSEEKAKSCADQEETAEESIKETVEENVTAEEILAETDAEEAVTKEPRETPALEEIREAENTVKRQVHSNEGARTHRQAATEIRVEEQKKSEPYYDFEDRDYSEYDLKHGYYQERSKRRSKRGNTKTQKNIDRIDKSRNKATKYRRKNANPIIKILVAIMVFVVAVYLATVLYFSCHMTWSYMNEDNLFNMTKGDLKALLQEEVNDYFIDVEAREMEPIYISAHDINMVCSFDGSENDLFKKQNKWLWFTYYFDPLQVEIPAKITFDENILAEYLDDALFNQPMRKPSNAKFVEDSANMAFVIRPEDNGTELIKEKTLEAVKTALVELEDFVDLDGSDCYTEAEIKTADLEKNELNKRLVDMCAMKIDVDWHGIPVTVDKEVIYPMLKHDDERAWVDYEDVFDYVKGLSRKYDLFGQPRKFTSTEGHEIEVVQGAYGWRVDRDATAQGLYELIEKGQSASYEPVYRYEAYARGEDDIGDSYAEINLTDQHLYIYKEGKVAFESDFVSGNVSHGNGTHVGIYGITYKERDATLKGQGYSSPVKYWMPFNGNEGMHDASWRKSFGGNIYKTNGSHGCVNLPTESAAKIFDMVEKGFPVIVFTDPESPNYNAKDDTPPAAVDPAEEVVNQADGVQIPVNPEGVLPDGASPVEGAPSVETPTVEAPAVESQIDAGVIDLTPAE